MSLALVCDGPTCSQSETDPEAVKRWWSLGRQGPFIGDQFPVHVASIRMSLFGGDDDEDRELTEEELEEAAEAATADLHFHSLACLMAWCELANSLEEA